MRKHILFLTVLTFLTFQIYGQTRTIVGRVLSEDVESLPGVRIQILDTLLIGETDIEGRFKIKISQGIDKLILRAIGMERTTIQINNACDSIEIVMMNDVIYDFVSPKRIDRLRLKRFKKLPELHLQAYTKGLFLSKTGYIQRTFEPDKPYFDEIKKEQMKMDIQTKQAFERLKIGDTIKIPYRGQYRSNEGDKLYVYSNLISNVMYSCVVEGKIISKNNFKKSYNLVYKVTNFDICKSPTEYKGKPLEIGDVFVHNMRNFKILSD